MIKNPEKILVACLGNADRSSALKGLLEMLYSHGGHAVRIDSCGVSESAKTGGAGPEAIVAMARIGIDLTTHKRCHVSAKTLDDYDLIICADPKVVEGMIEHGANPKKLYNVNIENPWPLQTQEDYDIITMPALFTAAYKILRIFSSQPS